MTTSVAFHNGQIVPASQLHVAVYDAGFVLGITIAEQLRTFNGTLFRLKQHLQRFEQSLSIIGLELPYSRAELTAAAERLVSDNHKLLTDGDDLGLCLFATPGPYPTMVPAEDRVGPTVAMHTYALPFGLFASTYQTGQHLVASGVPQIPAASLPRELKCRSRMHYYLADRDAAATDPKARALMLDTDGTVLEATTANVLIYRAGEGLISPPAERILPGISVAATLEIADELGIAYNARVVSVDDCLTADEVMLTSTSVCVLPVTAINGQAIGDGQPGEVFRQLLSGWQTLTGVDTKSQASRFARR